jgi:hypothetical protein
MKLIIDIDEELFNEVKLRYSYIGSAVWIAVANGKPYYAADHTKELVDYLYENHVSGDLSIEDMAGDILDLTRGDVDSE